jgi:hypothetical protein
MELTFCAQCGLLFNACHDDALTEYTDRNVETQAVSEHFLAFAHELARDWVERFELTGAHVIEVGPGHDAAFLRLFCDVSGGTGTGIGPSVDVGTSGGAVELVSALFDERFLDLDAKALICRHTLEHVPDVSMFLGHIARWSRRHDAVVLLEVPDTERILLETAFWDVYYEHCNYFTAASLRSSFEFAGLTVLGERRVYDDQYLIIEARAPGPPRSLHNPEVERIGRLADAFGAEAGRSIATVRARLEELSQKGPLLLWQAGSKAIALLATLPSPTDVTALVDANPGKWGSFVIGTGHRIIGPQDVRGISPATIVVMNPSYVEEVAAEMTHSGVDSVILSVNDLLEPTRRKTGEES